jgi:hypothetical protein
VGHPERTQCPLTILSAGRSLVCAPVSSTRNAD